MSFGIGVSANLAKSDNVADNKKDSGVEIGPPQTPSVSRMKEGVIDIDML